jgi:hypothetical protein
MAGWTSTRKFLVTQQRRTLVSRPLQQLPMPRRAGPKTCQPIPAQLHQLLLRMMASTRYTITAAVAVVVDKVSSVVVVGEADTVATVAEKATVVAEDTVAVSVGAVVVEVPAEAVSAVAATLRRKLQRPQHSRCLGFFRLSANSKAGRFVAVTVNQKPVHLATLHRQDHHIAWKDGCNDLESCRVRLARGLICIGC